jgi:hypothetical protein
MEKLPLRWPCEAPAVYFSQERWECCVREAREKGFQVREHTTLKGWLHSEIAPPDTEQTPISQEVNYVYQYRESTR